MNQLKTIEIKHAHYEFQNKISQLVDKIKYFDPFKIENLTKNQVPVAIIIFELLKDLNVGSYGQFEESKTYNSKYYLYKYSNIKILIINFGINGLNCIYSLGYDLINLLNNEHQLFHNDYIVKLRDSVKIDIKCKSELNSELC